MPPLAKNRASWHDDGMKLFPMIPILAALMACAQTTEEAVLDSARQTPRTATPAVPSETPPEAQQNAIPTVVAAVEYAPFPIESMYDLLTAELAVSRGHQDTAIESYMQQARITGDVRVIQRTYELASRAGYRSTALEAARIWHATEPQNSEALRTYAQELLHSGQWHAAVRSHIKLLEMHASVSFTALARAAADAVDADHESLLKTLVVVQQSFPKNRDLLMARALFNERLGHGTEALAQAALAHSELGDEGSTLAYADILLAQGNLQRALDVLQAQRRAQPHSLRIAETHLRTLRQTGESRKIRRALRNLLTTWPDHTQSKLDLALLDIEDGRFGAARSALLGLLNGSDPMPHLYFELGILEERAGRIQAALEAFEKLPPGPRFLEAQRKITDLLIGLGTPDTARSRLAKLRSQLPQLALPLYQVALDSYAKDDPSILDLFALALTEAPDNPELLLGRATARLQFADLAGMESDLNLLLKLEPNHPKALHTFGRALMMHTKRYAEAQELLQKALLLEPENAAHLASMGWLQYRVGNIERAVTLLQKAFDKEPSALTAAWLGETKWVGGQRTHALRIWRMAQRQWPDEDNLRRVVYRLTGRYRA